MLSVSYNPIGLETAPGEFHEGAIVVAKLEIPVGTQITADQVTMALIPNGSVPEGAFEKIDLVVGRVAITPIGLRETITTMKLAPEAMGDGLPAVIPEGYRAMTVKIDDVDSVSGFVMPESYVDVIAVITPAGTGDSISKIVCQNIKVLAAGARQIDDSEGHKIRKESVATLQMTSDQAELLIHSANEGKLRLVIRK